MKQVNRLDETQCSTLKEPGSNVDMSMEYREGRKTLKKTGKKWNAFSSCSLLIWNPAKTIGQEQLQDPTCPVSKLLFQFFSSLSTYWKPSAFRLKYESVSACFKGSLTSAGATSSLYLKLSFKINWCENIIMDTVESWRITATGTKPLLL